MKCTHAKTAALNPSHKFCPMCHTHWYEGREFTCAEWDKYVNAAFDEVAE